MYRLKIDQGDIGNEPHPAYDRVGFVVFGSSKTLTGGVGVVEKIVIFQEDPTKNY